MVGLLVGQPTATKDRDGVGAVLRSQACKAIGDQIECGVPRGGLKLAGRTVADHRRRQPLAGSEQTGRAPPLAAQSAFVDWELGPFLHLERAPDRPQRHAALQGAVGAVGLHCLRGLGHAFTEQLPDYASESPVLTG